MNKTDLHSSLLFLMIKLEEAKSEQMADKNFVAALTEVLRYFRDNGELKKAYDLQKDSLTDIANSPWVKLVMGMLTSKMQEDKVDAELPNIDALIEENTSDDFIEKKINDVLFDNVELKEELEICNETNPQDYRIKPKPKYRPFKNADECWKEMLKHQPFGYTYDSFNFIRDSITKVATTGVSYDSPTVISFKEIFDRFVFADGTPFGMKEED